MVEPTIKELSGVDHPAHLREGWLVVKDASPETADLLFRAECIAKGIDPTSVTSATTATTGASAMPTLTDEERAALPETAQEYIKSLETAAAAAAPAADLDADAFEKSLASLPEPVRKSIRDTQKRAADAEAMAKALHDERETSRFEDLAKQLARLPGVDANGEFATTMRKSAESNAAAFDGIFKVLKAADAAIAEAATWGAEIGSSVIGANSAAGSLQAIAKDMQAKDPELSEAEAMTKAAEANPELYAQHRKEV